MNQAGNRERAYLFASNADRSVRTSLLTLQAGQSGGPMFDEVGSVLGICVSNLKLDNTIYPNLNTSVPICDIKDILEQFAKSNGTKYNSIEFQ